MSDTTAREHWWWGAITVYLGLLAGLAGLSIGTTP